MFLFFLQKALQQLRRDIVSLFPANLNTVIEVRDRLELEVQVVPKLFPGDFPDVDLVIIGHVRCTVQVEDPLDGLFGMYHLLDGLLSGLFRQSPVTLVFIHLVVDEILVDGGQFVLQHVGQNIDDSLVVLQRSLL
jgi:hypothetical protein